MNDEGDWVAMEIEKLKTSALASEALKPIFMYAIAGAFFISLLITSLAGLTAGAIFACFAGFYMGLLIRKFRASLPSS